MDKKKYNDIVLQVEQLVIQDGIAGDINYFNFHRGRYLRMATQIGSLVKPGVGKKILEIGSHHLHSSLILRKMGFEVDAMDVSSFWDLPFVNSRRERLGLGKIVENDLANLPSLAHVEDRYDIVIFTEILEHITFNPVFFWQQVMRILKNDGIIYISTPNALTLISIFRTLKNLITLRGIGLGVNEILTMVTYGHHWKEYSAREVKTYFSAMSDGFSVTVRKYHYRQLKWRSFTEGAFKLLSAIGNATYVFADELEVVITVNKPSVWKIEPPGYSN